MAIPFDFAAIRDFRDFDRRTLEVPHELADSVMPTFVNQFWTGGQREAHSLHEVSYRACFKPQLPRFFIDRLSKKGHVVYDPFMGRGTTLLEAALRSRRVVGNDVNPVGRAFLEARLEPPTLEEVEFRLDEIDFGCASDEPDELLAFYHPQTLRQIAALRRRFRTTRLDPLDRWIRMVALSRLTGHSSGFFSTYTLPPNQAVSVESQRRINRKRGEKPPFRDVPSLILRKTKSLLRDVDCRTRQVLLNIDRPVLLQERADMTSVLPDDSVDLVVTSPPFMNVVDYAGDNWLRCWFLGVDEKRVGFTHFRDLEHWQEEMTSVFGELRRVLSPGGYVAFEVGEVHRRKVFLESLAIPAGIAAGLSPVCLLINDHEFTKTSDIWLRDATHGTHTNRVVVFRKDS